MPTAFSQARLCAWLLARQLQKPISTASGSVAQGGLFATTQLPTRLFAALPQHTAALRGFAAASISATTAPRPVSVLANYKQLSKFKLSALVVLTTGAGYIAGSGDSINWAGLAWTSLGTFGAAACANTLNQLYEISNDARMSRTCNRPLPAGRLSVPHAAGFAGICGLLGVGLLLHQANPLTAALGATNIILYAGIYTPFKQLSPINTWVGAVVGALPPLMGWAAASGGQLEPGAAVLAAALFSWQLPHFMALAWLNKADYLRGGFRMLSGIDPTGHRTAWVAVRHSLYLLPVGALAATAGVTSQWFAWEAAALAAIMAVPAARMAAAPTMQAARKLFRSSLLYLPLLMLGLVVHRIPNTHSVTWEGLWAEALAAMEGSPAQGALPFVRSYGERLGAAGLRILGVGQATMQELRCPSTVAADAGSQLADQGGEAAATLQGVQLGADDRHVGVRTLNRRHMCEGSGAFVAEAAACDSPPSGSCNSNHGQQQHDRVSSSATTNTTPTTSSLPAVQTADSDEGLSQLLQLQPHGWRWAGQPQPSVLPQR